MIQQDAGNVLHLLPLPQASVTVQECERGRFSFLLFWSSKLFQLLLCLCLSYLPTFNLLLQLISEFFLPRLLTLLKYRYLIFVALEPI